MIIAIVVSLWRLSAFPVLSSVEFEPHSAGINAVLCPGLGQAAVSTVIAAPEVVVARITDVVTDLGRVLALGQGTIIGSVQGPDVPLRELVRLSLAFIDSIGLASSVGVNLVECWESLDDIVDTFLVFPLPGVQTRLIAILRYSVALCMASLH